MSTTPYRAFIYADLTKASVQKLNTLPPSEIARISRFLQNYIFARPRPRTHRVTVGR